ncbi:MAG: hypothetical protein P8N02_19890 [Actinomycetota bacterium]|jgi:hypothetical protein|nr:hypothetical protein [Actinomycetota bacterium]
MSLLAVVGWDPTLTGYLAVLLSILVLCGSVFLLLATNIGMRLGFLVSWTGFWGWNLLMGLIWWVFGIGWIGQQPSWQVSHLASDPAGVPVEAVQDISNDLSETPSDWEVVVEADAQSAADSHVVCSDEDSRRLEAVNSCLFRAAAEYETHRILETGGERYRIFGIPDNAFTQYFIPSRGRPHYAVVQIQAYQQAQEIDPNQFGDDGKVVIPSAVLDTSAPVYSIVMYRDQGSLRLRPALVALLSGVLFGLGCYHLHRRDQAVWAVREAAGA